MAQRAWLDIGIGDAEQDQQEQAAWTASCAFLRAVHMQLGLPPSYDACSPEQLELAQEAYEADPAWAKQGAFSSHAPAGVSAGRLTLALSSPAKKAVQNFLALCTGEKGLSKASKKPLHYKGCPFHRIVAGFMCQGGDVGRGDGSGSESIYGGKFNDEKPGLQLKHDRAGILSMANSGRNSNSSQFFLTFGPAPQCDGKHVVLGEVAEGLHILQRIEREAASSDGVPRSLVWIIDCGLC